MDAHPLAASRVVFEVAVLDGFVEDGREGVDHLADRRRRERHDLLIAVVA
ncbi:MAG TPA: hypothetical protein VES65_11515 [Solirubrobacteraceae bacterium]|nr:hypothetical protein [Solirubrobacteraceae bacterium]